MDFSVTSCFFLVFMVSSILVPKDELEDLCNQVDMDLGKYINLLKEALGIVKEAKTFSYVISQNDLSVKVILAHFSPVLQVYTP